MARRRRSNLNAQRRKRVWARRTQSIQTGSGSPVSGSADVLNDFRTLMGADTVGVTVAAVRGRIMALGGSETALDDPAALVVGLRVASTINPPADGPRGDPGSDWMYIDTVYPPYVVASRPELNVRAQRKVDEIGQSLFLAWDRRDTQSAAVHLHYDLSVMLMLP